MLSADHSPRVAAGEVRRAPRHRAASWGTQVGQAVPTPTTSLEKHHCEKHQIEKFDKFGFLSSNFISNE